MKTRLLNTRIILSFMILLSFGFTAKADQVNGPINALDAFNEGRSARIDSLRDVEQKSKAEKTKPNTFLDRRVVKNDAKANSLASTAKQVELLKDIFNTQDSTFVKQVLELKTHKKAYDDVKDINEKSERALEASAKLASGGSLNIQTPAELNEGDQVCNGRTAEAIKIGKAFAEENIQREAQVRGNETSKIIKKGEEKRDNQERTALTDFISYMKKLTKPKTDKKAIAKLAKLHSDEEIEEELESQVATEKKMNEAADESLSNAFVKAFEANKKHEKNNKNLDSVKQVAITNIVTIIKGSVAKLTEGATAAYQQCKAQEKELDKAINSRNGVMMVAQAMNPQWFASQEGQAWVKELKAEKEGIKCVNNSQAVEAEGNKLVTQAQALGGVQDESVFAESLMNFIKGGVSNTFTNMAKQVIPTVKNCNLLVEKTKKAKSFSKENQEAIAMQQPQQQGPGGFPQGTQQPGQGFGGRDQSIKLPQTQSQQHDARI